jgi:hypothetical protein
VRRAGSRTTLMFRLSRHLGASTSWNPQGLSRPVMGLLYLSEGKIIYSYFRITNKNYFLIRVLLYAVIKKNMLRFSILIE